MAGPSSAIRRPPQRAPRLANGNGNPGELVLDHSQTFTGQIFGFAGDGTISNSDLIDVKDVNFANVATDKTTYVDSANETGTLVLHNAQGQALASITFAGNYVLANFTIQNDGSGGVLIIDPPVKSDAAPHVQSGHTESVQTVGVHLDYHQTGLLHA
jgi:hypothetical protein